MNHQKMDKHMAKDKYIKFDLIHNKIKMEKVMQYFEVFQVISIIYVLYKYYNNKNNYGHIYK